MEVAGSRAQLLVLDDETAGRTFQHDTHRHEETKMEASLF